MALVHGITESTGSWGPVAERLSATHRVITLDLSSVVDVDQSLQLGSFKDQIVAVEAMLRDPEQYRAVVDTMFEMMSGELLAADEVARVNALRRAEHEVVLLPVLRPRQLLALRPRQLPVLGPDRRAARRRPPGRAGFSRTRRGPDRPHC